MLATVTVTDPVTVGRVVSVTVTVRAPALRSTTPVIVRTPLSAAVNVDGAGRVAPGSVLVSATVPR